jgi:selenide,water dikinase
VLLGFETSDDAAVYRVSHDLAVVQSLDVLTPVVDDPFDFGRIAAANSVSDIYAMGAVPRFSLSFAGFPRSVLPMEILQQITAGAVQVVTEAGAPIIGGHSIDDPEPKFGLAVTGMIHPDRVTTNAAGQVGDVLILTKPIGSGVLTTAAKRGDERLSAADLQQAIEWMATLNAAAARAMAAVGGRCATDVTGFGLLGHLHEVAAGSGLGARLHVSAVPLMDGAAVLAAADVFPGGSRRNLGYLADHLRVDSDVSMTSQLLFADAQTSGGLLLAVAEPLAQRLLTELANHGVQVAAVIGELVDGPPGSIHLSA